MLKLHPEPSGSILTSVEESPAREVDFDPSPLLKLNPPPEVLELLPEPSGSILTAVEESPAEEDRPQTLLKLFPSPVLIQFPWTSCAERGRQEKRVSTSEP